VNASYRTAPPVAPPTLITYRPGGTVRPLWVSWCLTIVIVVSIATGLGQELSLQILRALTFTLPSVFVAHRTWQRALLRFDWASRRLILERSRWPLPGTSRSFSLDEVTGVEVFETAATPHRARQYHLVLALASGERVPLIGGSSNVRGHHERVAAEILAALGRKEAALHGASEDGPPRLA
jgi:hypothetical protein